MFFDALTEQIPGTAFSDDTEKFPTTITFRTMTLLKKIVFTIHEISKKMSYTERQFLIDLKAVLFATGSMWEGVNIPGDILSHLIIVKLPFPILDPISDYEKSLYPDMNEYLKSVLIPKMLIKLRQGVDRLIRSETDTDVISILDVRASNTGRYHQEVIHVLPECKRAESINDIQAF